MEGNEKIDGESCEPIERIVVRLVELERSMDSCSRALGDPQLEFLHDDKREEWEETIAEHDHRCDILESGRYLGAMSSDTHEELLNVERRIEQERRLAEYRACLESPGLECEHDLARGKIEQYLRIWDNVEKARAQGTTATEKTEVESLKGDSATKVTEVESLKGTTSTGECSDPHLGVMLSGRQEEGSKQLNPIEKAWWENGRWDPQNRYTM